MSDCYQPITLPLFYTASIDDEDNPTPNVPTNRSEGGGRCSFIFQGMGFFWVDYQTDVLEREAESPQGQRTIKFQSDACALPLITV